MQFADASDFLAVPGYRGASGRVFPYPWIDGADMRSVSEALRNALQLQKFRDAFAFRINSRHQVRGLVWRRTGTLVDLVSAFEDAELIEVFGVFEYVAVDPRQQRGPHQVLPRRDRVQYADVIFYSEPEPARFFLTDE